MPDPNPPTAPAAPPNPPTYVTPPDPALQRYKERVAAWFGGAIVALTVGLAIFAATRISDKDPNHAFTQAKDLLLFINPILGVVIGYYFNKTMADAGVHRAETAAANATNQAIKADDKNKKLTTALADVMAEGKALVSGKGAQAKTLAAPQGAPANDFASLSAAIDRAEAVLRS